MVTELRDVLSENTADHPYALVRAGQPGLAFVSGVVPYGPDGEVVTERDAAIATALRELGRRAAAAGGSLADVVNVTVFLTDIGWRDALNRAWVESFPQVPRPARTAVEVRRLPKDAPIELQAVLVLGGRA